MSNYFTMYFYETVGVAVLAFTYCSGYHCYSFYKIVGVAVLAFTYHSGYHCYSYYLSDYKLGVHVYCLWPPPFLLFVCTTVVCVQFVATPTSTISVYYFSTIHVYYFSTSHVYYFSSIRVYYFSTISVYYFSTIHVNYFTIIIVYSISLYCYHCYYFVYNNNSV